MRKIFWRSDFIPLPLRERAGMRGILFSAFLIAAGSVAAFGQNNSGQASNAAPSATAKESRLMSSAVKKGFEKRKTELLTMLADYRAGKYTDIQGHAILFQVLIACGQLKEKQSPDCQSALKEYKALNRAHPEFQNPPEFHKKYPNLTASDLLNIELPSRKAAQDQNTKSWTPLDNDWVEYDNYKNDLALVYQYRIEFFNLNPSEIEPSGIVHVSKISEKPHKIMTFQEAINVKPTPSWPPRTNPAIAVCTDPTLDYEPRTEAEQKIVGIGKSMPWRNPKGEFHDFCGVINADGTIAAQIPRPWKLPIYKPLGISSDGKEAVFGAGHRGMVKEDPNHQEFVCQYIIHWTYPNKIEKLDARKLTENQFNLNPAVKRPLLGVVEPRGAAARSS